MLSAADKTLMARERNIAVAILRYGANLIDPETGLTVTQFISEELQTDGITLQIPLYSKVMEAALALIAEGVSTDLWLARMLSHPDDDIANFANDMADDRYVLCQHQQMMHRPDEERLAEIVPQLVMELKYSVLEGLIRDLRLRINDPRTQADAELSLQLLTQLRDLHAVKREMAQALGGRVIG